MSEELRAAASQLLTALNLRDAIAATSDNASDQQLLDASARAWIARDRLAAALASAPANSGWQTIDENTPRDGTRLLLAAYVVPSEEAQRNGSKPFWDIGIGAAYGSQGDRWSGILGTRADYWMPRPAPPSDVPGGATTNTNRR